MLESFSQNNTPRKQTESLPVLPPFIEVRGDEKGLQNKLAEYKERLARSAYPVTEEEIAEGKIPAQSLDTVLKIVVLQELLEKQIIDTSALLDRVQKFTNFSYETFCNACGVIYSYAQRGGVGLTKVKPKPNLKN
jgi:hypothetical protein